MILVLGGTAEARKLAEALGARAILSLKGTTRHPQAIAQRVGGFGGVAGLTRYLDEAGITRIIDATHPFAAQMSAHAVAAAGGRPLLRVQRPAWETKPEWRQVDTLTEAATALPAGARVFLTVGSHSLAPFLQREDIWCLTRAIEPPTRLPRHGMLELARPPFTLASEMALMEQHKISHLVSKNAGGRATATKLEAAAALNVQVIMVKNPRLPEVLTVETVAEAVKWLERQGD